MPVRYRPISRKRSNRIGTPGLTPIDDITSHGSSIEPDALTGKIAAQDDDQPKKKSRQGRAPARDQK